jgi:hypothetical protein
MVGTRFRDQFGDHDLKGTCSSELGQRGCSVGTIAHIKHQRVLNIKSNVHSMCG